MGLQRSCKFRGPRRCLQAGLLAFAMVSGISACALLFKTNVTDLALVDVSWVGIDRSPHRLSQANRPGLLVRFQTRQDLAKAAVEDELMYVDAKIANCATGNKAGWSPVFRQGVEVLEARRSGGWLSTARSDIHLYEIWFDYSFHEHPQDLCLELEGAPYMGLGRGLTSDILVIPKESIAAALRDFRRKRPASDNVIDEAPAAK
jgi:hypothetical protein